MCYLREIPFNDAAIADLRRFGVDASKIVRAKRRVGTYYVEAGTNQRPSKVVYDHEHTCNCACQVRRRRLEPDPRTGKLVSLDWNHTCDLRFGR